MRAPPPLVFQDLASGEPTAHCPVLGPMWLLEPSLQERISMTLTVAHLQPIVSLIARILIVIVPRLLNYIVAIFLIVSGVIGLGLIH
jgi:Protein of unknown function (DUF3096)